MSAIPSITKKGVATVLLAAVLSFSIIAPAAPAYASDGGAGWSLVTKEYILDLIGRIIASAMTTALTNQIISWIQGQGNQGFASDFQLALQDRADQAAGEFLQKVLPNVNLCTPFKAQLQIAFPPKKFKERVSCTATQALANLQTSIDQFYSDFTQGGWDALVVITSEENYYPDVVMNLYDEKLRRESVAANQFTQQYSAGKGFLGMTVTKQVTQCYPNYEDSSAGEICVPINTYENTTPGELVAQTVNQAGTAGLEQLINADEINEALLAIGKALIGRIIQSGQGMFSSTGDEDTSLSTMTFTASQNSLLIAKIDEAILKADQGIAQLEAQIADIDGQIASLKESCGGQPCPQDVLDQIQALEDEKVPLEEQRDRINDLRVQLLTIKTQILNTTDPAILEQMTIQLDQILSNLAQELNALGITLLGSSATTTTFLNTIMMLDNAINRASTTIASLDKAIPVEPDAAKKAQMEQVKADLERLVSEAEQIKADLYANQSDPDEVLLLTIEATNKILEIDAKIKEANQLL